MFVTVVIVIAIYERLLFFSHILFCTLFLLTAIILIFVNVDVVNLVLDPGRPFALQMIDWLNHDNLCWRCHCHCYIVVDTVVAVAV